MTSRERSMSDSELGSHAINNNQVLDDPILNTGQKSEDGKPIELEDQEQHSDKNERILTSPDSNWQLITTNEQFKSQHELDEKKLKKSKNVIKNLLKVAHKKSSELEEIKKEIWNLHAELDKEKEELKLALQKKNDDLAEGERIIDALEKELRKKTTELDGLEKELRKKTTELDGLEKELQEKTEANEIIDAEQKKSAELEKELQKKNKEVDGLVKEVDGLVKELQKMNTEVDEGKQHIKKYYAEHQKSTKLEKDNEILERQLTKKDAEVEQANINCQLSNQSKEECKLKYQRHLQELYDTIPRLEMEIQDLQLEVEDYRNAVRQLARKEHKRDRQNARTSAVENERTDNRSNHAPGWQSHAEEALKDDSEISSLDDVSIAVRNVRDTTEPVPATESLKPAKLQL